MTEEATSRLTPNAKFSIGTNIRARSGRYDNYVGFCWGFLSFPEPDGNGHVVCVATPDERNRILAVQHVDEDVGNPNQLINEPYIQRHVAEEKFYFLHRRIDPWSSNLFLRPHQQDLEWLLPRVNLISQYLKRVVSPYDFDTEIYTLPDDEEMERVVMNTKAKI